jgi:hypothetical protein
MTVPGAARRGLSPGMSDRRPTVVRVNLEVQQQRPCEVMPDAVGTGSWVAVMGRGQAFGSDMGPSVGSGRQAAEPDITPKARQMGWNSPGAQDWLPR